MRKEAIRQKVLARMATAGVVRFPGMQSSIPNFEGAGHAVRLLRQLPMWKRARVICIGPGAPQVLARRQALADGKIVYVALPGLRAERCFIELDPRRLGSRSARAASICNATQLGRALTPYESRSIDLVVVGAVAATRQGARLGAGHGATDIEYALLRQALKVREYTPIVAVVHPSQIITERIPMRAHDVPVDFLITPDRVIAAPSLYPRPRGVLWDLLPPERIQASPILRKGRRIAREQRRPGML